ncbi:hypothetical protein BCR36DRAFT_157531 [Piromyces finnis]|uniref:Transglutaminase-like domain-containing protein n=1 Tax=Piromyces finnis TaxID=1754191 RepID=A0A1Y1UXV6_9FUNG|nr:hypothetical protein BCR36DRAFT_157531 [Piromyces finnis]|eukprot:ORX42563.1 hypothetical protein BCR36DRAFT_157531 [Piromyces finnis]
MKLGKLLFAVLNASVAFGAAILDKQQHDDTFNFWVSGPNGGTATIVGLRNNATTAKSVTFPAYVYVQGIKFKVTGVLDHTFNDSYCPFESIYIASGVESFHFDHYTFNGCKNLKRVYLSNQKVTAELTSFKDVNKDVTFYSRGTKSFVNDYVEKLAKSLGIEKKNYSSLANYYKKENLFEIAKKTQTYLRTSDVKDSGSVAVNLVTKFGTRDGYARLFRLLCIASGFPESDIRVGGDGNGYYWNYVKIGNCWSNVDINYSYRVYSTYSSAVSKKPFFLSDGAFKQRLSEDYGITVNKFYVYYTNYGYPDEFNGQQTHEVFTGTKCTSSN